MSTDFLEENLSSVIGDMLLIQLNAFSPCSHLLEHLSRELTLKPTPVGEEEEMLCGKRESMHFGEAGLDSSADCHFVVL